jgi:hypothetical protein
MDGLFDDLRAMRAAVDVQTTVKRRVDVGPLLLSLISSYARRRPLHAQGSVLRDSKIVTAKGHVREIDSGY